MLLLLSLLLLLYIVAFYRGVHIFGLIHIHRRMSLWICSHAKISAPQEQVVHTDVLVLTNQKEFTYNSSVWTQDVVEKTCHKRWIIRMNGERERLREIQVSNTTWWWWLWWHIHIFVTNNTCFDYIMFNSKS